MVEKIPTSSCNSDGNQNFFDLRNEIQLFEMPFHFQRKEEFHTVD